MSRRSERSVDLSETPASRRAKEKIVRLVICFAVALAFNVQPNFAQQNPQNRVDAQTSETRQLPPVAVEAQPGSPLELSVRRMRWATPTPEVLDMYLAVKNIGALPVRAYATRTGKPEQGGCFIYNVTAPGKVIQPEQSDSRSRFVGVSSASAPEVIRVAVDFVEFTDGTTWGEDRCETAELLAGERAGGRAAIELLREIFRQEGAEAVLQKIKNSALEPEPPGDHSERWKSAFRGAIKTVVERVRRAYDEEGLKEIETMLNKPYDAAGAK
ncbi:MAG TPA: hypothetical protein VGB76_18065 [Pyrinomonadaceae bacterium]